jgi:hypothetical protein
MGEGLPGDAVERGEYRQVLACSSDRRTIAAYGRVSPAAQHVVGLLGLGCQDQNVVNVELDLLRGADGRELSRDILIRRPQPQSALLEDRQMIATGHQDNAAAGQRESTA